MTRSRKLFWVFVIVGVLAIAWFSGYLPVAILIVMESMSEPVPPERPESVPPEAVWAGGFDGGVFIDCIEIKESDSCFDCVVYFDYSGDIWIRDTFCVDEGTIRMDSLRHVYGGFVGQDIFLTDGRRLAPLTDRGSIGDPEYDKWYDNQVSAGWHMETFRR